MTCSEGIVQEFRAFTVTYTRNSITAAGVSLTVGEPGLGMNYSRLCPCYLWIYLRSESMIISSTATDVCHIRINMNWLNMSVCGYYKPGNHFARFMFVNRLTLKLHCGWNYEYE